MTNNHYILTENHELKIVPLLEWAEWFENAKENRIVKQDEIDKIMVSTVFIGLDHNFTNDGPALLFETMIFGGPRDGEIVDRYSTWDEAEKGHEKTLKELNKIYE